MKNSTYFDPTELLAAKGIRRISQRTVSKRIKKTNGTVAKVFAGGDVKLSTLLAVAKAVHCRAKIVIERE